MLLATNLVFVIVSTLAVVLIPIITPAGSIVLWTVLMFAWVRLAYPVSRGR